MNKKNTVKKTAALLLGLALTVGATGCNFVVTDTAKDYAQEIANVDNNAIQIFFFFTFINLLFN